MSRLVGRVARMIWGAAALLVFAWAQLAFDGTPNWDGDEVALYALLALGFPAALLGVAAIVGVFAAIYWVSGIEIATGRLEMALTWCVLVMCGYLQWFILIPALARRLRTRPTTAGRSRA